MKYAIIPIFKIIRLLFLFFIASIVKWICYLWFKFEFININEALTFDGICLLDIKFMEYINEIFSKESTNKFIKEFINETNKGYTN